MIRTIDFIEFFDGLINSSVINDTSLIFFYKYIFLKTNSYIERLMFFFVAVNLSCKKRTITGNNDVIGFLFFL